MTGADSQGQQSPLERSLAGRILPFQHSGSVAASSAVEIDLSSPAATSSVPSEVADAVSRSLEAGETHYTARTGIAPLREAIARYSTDAGFPASAETVIVTNGGTEALFIALQTLVTSGGKVVLVEPVAPYLETLVTFLGGEAQRVASPASLNLSGVAVVVVAHASGIDGRIVADSDLVDLMESAAASGAVVVLDRSDVPNCYVEPQPFSQTDLTSGIITIGSFSGAFGLAGWRAGFFTAPEQLMPRLAGLKESMSISTSTPAQFAALAALEHEVTILGDARERAIIRRDLVIGLLDQHGLAYRMPDVYLGFLLDVRASGQSDTDLAAQLESDAGVRVEPASRYGASLTGFIRIDLNAPTDILETGVQRIARFLDWVER